MKPLACLLLLLAWPTPARSQVDSSTPQQVPLSTFTGATLGHLTLGISTPEEARQALDTLGGLGPKRDNAVTFTVGGRTMRPRLLYTPPATSNQLYFDRNVLVLLVEGSPRETAGTVEAFKTRYPAARETQRQPGWYEMQVQLAPCVWLIAVFGTADDALQSDGYAYTCRPR